MIDIDLFAGAGGLAVGLHSAGFEPVDLYELDSTACKTLRKNISANNGEHGFPYTLEVSALPQKSGEPGFSAEGTVLHDGSPRVIQIDGISLEAPLAETILYLRNHD